MCVVISVKKGCCYEEPIRVSMVSGKFERNYMFTKNMGNYRIVLFNVLIN